MRRLACTCALLVWSCTDPVAPPPTPAPEKAGEPPRDVLAIGGVTSEPLSERPPAPTGPRFESLSAERTGLDFRHRWNEKAEHEWEFANAFAGGGVALGDYDGDGLVDAYLTRPAGGGKLYRNLGEWRFEDVTEKVGVATDRWTTGPTFVDLEGDGDLDLFVGVYAGPNHVFINEDGRFTDQAEALGLAFSGATVAGAFADYDRDGDLDLYLLTNRQPSTEPVQGNTRRVGGELQVPPEHADYIMVMEPEPGKPVFSKAGQRDRLYRNDDGRFVEVSAAMGIEGHDIGLGVRWWDFDDDGWLDLYVANDFFTPDRLYRNVDGIRFEDVSAMALPYTPWFSMGVDAADVDGDGWMDFFATDMAGTTHFKQKLSMGDMNDDGWFLEHAEPRQYMRNMFYVNTGSGRFLEVAKLAGVASTDWTWSPRFADLDEDGRVDLFVTNGMTRDFSDSDLRAKLKQQGKWQEGDLAFWKDAPRREEPNLAFRNRGELKFESIGQRWGLGHVGISFGAALGDLDGDGDLDLVVNDFEAPAKVFRNHTTGTHRALVRLVGPRGNAWGVGAKLTAHVGRERLVRDLPASSGFMSANAPLVHFGLGERDRIDKLEVRWPDGRHQVFEALAADQLHTIRYDAQAPTWSVPPAGDMLFLPPMPARRWRHQETPFDDFARQPLLPMKHSQMGPGFAQGDVNGDGRDDLFLGGAAGQAGTLWIGRAGGFAPARGAQPFAADAASEDLGALFFDADADGDLDLYVVSGGVEGEPGDVVFRDRLYLNDGGDFTKAADALPDVRDSGAAVTVSDFDGDGDLDLFVGGRVVPGRYPEAPSSRLLRNEGGRFVDVTDTIAPGLRQAGLVTGAAWVRLDEASGPDLLVAHEWGPVRLWRNRKGQLVDGTADAGLDRWSGWWSALAPGDFDGDGDLDFVAGNVGLNTKYHASKDKPTQLFYGPYGADGDMHLVEAEYEGDTLYPVRGRSCSSDAMPELAERFPSFEAFAKAPLTDIYAEETLAKGKKLSADTLAAGLFVNEGGRFEFRPFPDRAQIAPASGVAVADYDADGHLDVYLAQNSWAPQRETGRWAGGVGQLLRGLGDGRFEVVPVEKSGLVVPFDASAAAVADLDGDAQPDLVHALNDGPYLLQRRKPGAAGLAVRLKGPQGNPTGVGARVTVRRSDGRGLTRWVRADAGLGQRSPAAFFGLGGAQVEKVTVRWPGGQTSEATPEGARLTIAHP